MQAWVNMMFQLFVKIYRKAKNVARKVIRLFWPGPEEIFSVQQHLADAGKKPSLRYLASSVGLSYPKTLLSLLLLKTNGLSEADFALDFPKQSTGKAIGKVYFRTIFYAPHEIPFIKMNLWESSPHIDKFIIVEGNRTQVGESREFIFENYLERIPRELRNKILYIPADISSQTLDCSETNDGVQMHKNEDVLWDCFEKHISLSSDDIVIAADADEIIFQHMYPIILKKLRRNSPFIIPLHQFFYKMNYLWENVTFWAPVASYASYYLDKPYPHRWRYEGTPFPFMAGCHFSWQLTIEEMIFKLKTYAHRDIYGHFAVPEILEKAVREKTYPFDPDRAFSIRELDPDKDRSHYPRSFYRFREDFAALLPESQRRALL